MANTLNAELVGRYVVLKESSMAAPYQDIPNRVFKVTGGFGASSFTIGTSLLGTTPIDGDIFTMSGLDVERFATDAEIAAVTEVTT